MAVITGVWLLHFHSPLDQAWHCILLAAVFHMANHCSGIDSCELHHADLLMSASILRIKRLGRLCRAIRLKMLHFLAQLDMIIISVIARAFDQA